MRKSVSRKGGKKVMVVIGIILAVFIGLMVIGFIVNPIISRGELEKIAPYGQMVEVDGKRMHVYAMGEGSETVVLLPGFGVSLPSADFGPLMRELSKHHTVVTVEYFGIGFSEQTDTPRTNENYTHEIREALKKAGFTPPYILMPHSASGVYSEYYASRYPGEIKGIIMLDTTSTGETVTKNPPGFVFSIAKFQQRIGMTRLNAKLAPETKKIENGYTQKEISDYATFTAHVLNDTMIDQSMRLGANINEVHVLQFPDHIPVMKLISTQSVKIIAKQRKGDGMGYQQQHLKKLGAQANYQIINASHFVYQTKAAEIADIATRFISNIER